MKNFKTLLLIAVFTLGLGGITNAQKVAHLILKELLLICLKQEHCSQIWTKKQRQ